jgi:hypothetical protein
MSFLKINNNFFKTGCYILVLFLVDATWAMWHPRHFMRGLYLSNNIINTDIGYMNLQNVDHNACQINGANVPNQIALGSDVFTRNLCGQLVTVKVGDSEVQGMVIDALDAANRVMVSPNLFEQFSTLDTGIVQGSVILPPGSQVTQNNVASFLLPSNATVLSPSLSPVSISYDQSSSLPEKSISDLQGTLEGKQIGNVPIMQAPTVQAPMDINDGYQHVLYQSNPADSNDMSFYYDLNGAGTCGPANGISSYIESNGYAMCEPNAGYQTLRERNTNNIVAIPVSLLSQNKAAYCGKRIIATVNGVERKDLNLVVWDGCVANDANGNGGLDLSSTMFAELVGAERCGEGRIQNELSWKIIDEQLIDWHE